MKHNKLLILMRTLSMGLVFELVMVGCATTQTAEHTYVFNITNKSDHTLIGIELFDGGNNEKMGGGQYILKMGPGSSETVNYPTAYNNWKWISFQSEDGFIFGDSGAEFPEGELGPFNIELSNDGIIFTKAQ